MRDSTATSSFARLDDLKAELSGRHPHWHIWYVVGAEHITWCARREPVLNRPSRAALEEAIAAIECDGNQAASTDDALRVTASQNAHAPARNVPDAAQSVSPQPADAETTDQDSYPARDSSPA